MGLFRKNNSPDIIYTNAKIYTMDRDFPEAQAIAVKGSVIVDVGEADLVEGTAGKNTVIKDLGGAYVLPGFIDSVSMISPQLMNRMLPPERMKGKTAEEIQEIIDKLDIPRVQTNVLTQAEEHAQKGFTTVLLYGAPMFFDDIYQQVLMTMLQENMAKQRIYAGCTISHDVNVPMLINFLMQRHANCLEADDLLNYDVLRLPVNTQAENGFTADGLLSLASAALDRGFKIIFEALDMPAVKMCLDVIVKTAIPGEKSRIILYHEQELSEEDYPENLDRNDFTEIKSLAKTGEGSLFETVKGLSGKEAVEKLTVEAAQTLGIEGLCGSIEVGKSADFAVYQSDPYQTEPSALEAELTVLAGNEVYEKGADFKTEWQEKMADFFEFLDEEEFGANRFEAEAEEGRYKECTHGA